MGRGTSARFAKFSLSSWDHGHDLFPLCRRLPDGFVKKDQMGKKRYGV
jgi:hypothetical protein